MCIIKIENENHKVVATKKVKNKPFHSAKQNGLFFYLLKITTNAIIKAIAMIVTTTNPENSRYIICRYIVSIAPPRFPTDVLWSLKVATHSALFSFPGIEFIIIWYIKQANILKNFDKMLNFLWIFGKIVMSIIISTWKP